MLGLIGFYVGFEVRFCSFFTVIPAQKPLRKVRNSGKSPRVRAGVRVNVSYCSPKVLSRSLTLLTLLSEGKPRAAWTVINVRKVLTRVWRRYTLVGIPWYVHPGGYTPPPGTPLYLRTLGIPPCTHHRHGSACTAQCPDQ